KLVRRVLEPPAGAKLPYATGNPQSIGVDSERSLYYADIALIIIIMPEGGATEVDEGMHLRRDEATVRIDGVDPALADRPIEHDRFARPATMTQRGVARTSKRARGPSPRLRRRFQAPRSSRRDSVGGRHVEGYGRRAR